LSMGVLLQTWVGHEPPDYWKPFGIQVTDMTSSFKVLTRRVSRGG